jgi:glycosyltransferase involved in cell wall biosynthesis
MHKSVLSMVEYYQQSDLYIKPLRSTKGIADICNSILEAYACGLPVISSDVGGNSEIVLDRHLVKPDSPVELADKIVEVLQEKWDPWMFRNRVCNYSWEKVTERYRKAFEYAVNH